VVPCGTWGGFTTGTSAGEAQRTKVTAEITQ